MQKGNDNDDLSRRSTNYDVNGDREDDEDDQADEYHDDDDA